jgi:porphobilinogen synthase
MGCAVPERDPLRDQLQAPVQLPAQLPVLPPVQTPLQVPLHGPLHPLIRPRRLRSTPALRRLVAETRIHPADLILPMFIREGATEAQPIVSMPGVVQHSLDSFKVALDQAAAAGIGGVMLFGVPEKKDAVGSGAVDPNGILNVATRVAVEAVGDALVVQTDLCLDEFTDHGHCGVLDVTSRPGTVIIDNDATLAVYREMALAQANAGSQLLGLSGMMDGQVAAVRDALDGNGFSDIAVLAYSAKYASAFYGPFREAVQSSLVGNRRSYQLDPGNRREGLREVELDIAEGADIVMVKPAMSYLDVLADTAAISSVPVWAYQVSGEYSMIEAAAANGWIDRERAVYESVLSIRRAGADAVLTYFAVELARWLNAGAR